MSNEIPFDVPDAPEGTQVLVSSTTKFTDLKLGFVTKKKTRSVEVLCQTVEGMPRFHTAYHLTDPRVEQRKRQINEDPFTGVWDFAEPEKQRRQVFVVVRNLQERVEKMENEVRTLRQPPPKPASEKPRTGRGRAPKSDPKIKPGSMVV